MRECACRLDQAKPADSEANAQQRTQRGGRFNTLPARSANPVANINQIEGGKVVS